MNMIALVSDQRMQNVIPIYQKGANYDRVVLVLSKDRRTGRPLPRFVHSADDLAAVLKAKVAEVTVAEETVDPFDIGNVKAVLTTIIEAHNSSSELVINISGGTKPMAIGALQAAQSARIRSVYTDTEDGELIWLSADGSVATERIDVCDLDVATYVRAYGERVAASMRMEQFDPKLVQWAQVIGDKHNVLFAQVINPVNRAVQEALKAGKAPPITCPVTVGRRQVEAIVQLADAGLWLWNEAGRTITVQSKQVAQFLNGGWVETYVGHRIVTSGCFDDVLLNVTLDGVEGEIDLAGVANGRLFLVECKSGVQRSEHLAKLHSFRERLGGPFAKAYYARASDSYARQISAQCRKFKLNGEFFGSQLADIGAEIGRDFGAVPRPAAGLQVIAQPQ